MEKRCRTCEHFPRTIEGTKCLPCLDATPSLPYWEPITVTKQALFVDSPDPAGRKDDDGKLDVTLFFDDLPHAIEAVAEVLQWAITKKTPKPYVRGSWQYVDDFSRRYHGAMLRHQLNRAKALKGTVIAPAGEPTDAETGLMELAHIATDAMFLLEMAVRKAKGLPTPEGA